MFVLLHHAISPLSLAIGMLPKSYLSFEMVVASFALMVPNIIVVILAA